MLIVDSTTNNIVLNLLKISKTNTFTSKPNFNWIFPIYRTNNELLILLPGISLSLGIEGSPPVAIRIWGAVYFLPSTSIVGLSSDVNLALP